MTLQALYCLHTSSGPQAAVCTGGLSSPVQLERPSPNHTRQDHEAEMLESAKTGYSLLAWAAAVVCPLCIHLPMTNVVLSVCRLEKELAAAMVMAGWPHAQSGLIKAAGGKTLPNTAMANNRVWCCVRISVKILC